MAELASLKRHVDGQLLPPAVGKSSIGGNAQTIVDQDINLNDPRAKSGFYDIARLNCAIFGICNDNI